MPCLHEFFLNYVQTTLNDFILKVARPKQWDMYNFILVRKVIELAMEKSNNDREETSLLLVHAVNRLGLTQIDLAYALDYLVWNSATIAVDVPHARTYIAGYIARAIYDGILNPLYILEAQVSSSEAAEIEYDIL